MKKEKLKQVMCRFCNTPAVAIYSMSDGCICFPNDREQALCAQHENRATPLGDMIMIQDLRIL